MTPRRLFDVWAAYDPTRLAARAVHAARSVPGFGEIERIAEQIERRVLRDVSARSTEVLALPAGQTQAPPTPAELLSALLKQATTENLRQSQTREFTRILGRLSPDEARILAAMSDGSSFAVIDVIIPASPRRPSRTILENASDVGRGAGVTFPDRVPEYVSHLLSLGLVELAEPLEQLNSSYEILETDARIRRAKKRASDLTRLPIIINRQTLRLSKLGAALWTASNLS